MTINITFPDGKTKEYKKGITPGEIAEDIRLRDVLTAKVNGEPWDLMRPIEASAKINLYRYDSPEGKEVFWHTSDHILAQAVNRLYPNAKITIGPNWENGYFYDIDHEPFTAEDLQKIEAEMQKIVDADFKVERKTYSKPEATQIFHSNKYKVELVKEAEGKDITVYLQGEFLDLCKGPHLPRTGLVKAFKLTKTSGAYWKGDQKNKQLQRIYGVSFPERKQLTEYLKMMEEAEKRDHRNLGKRLELFMFHDWSPGSPIILPKGTIIYNILVEFIRIEYKKRGYNEVITPQLFNKALWELSGHWQHYQENMFILKVDNEDFSLKPMNCPSHVLIFKNKTRSYRELPLRIADFCNLHRNELKGVLGGMTRVRKFSQDDAHIFCTEEQIQEEITRLIDFFKYIYDDVFKLSYAVYLSTKPEKAMGTDEQWEKAENALAESLNANGIKFQIKAGEGAFYGPKIDVDVKDSLGRTWQLTTIQLDFQMPQRMDIEYEGQDGKKHRPVMVHRALIGAFERFLGVLTEHFAGKFPLWLSPEQVRILSVADRFNDYAKLLSDKFEKKGIRARVDGRTESINFKVREAQLDYVNYIIVVGEKEVKANTITIRTRDNQIIGEKDSDEFLKQLLLEIEQKKL